jgi:hypothetical protein
VDGQIVAHITTSRKKKSCTDCNILRLVGSLSGDYSELMEFGAIVFWLGIATITGLAASSRGRNGFGWFLAGLLFSVLALLAVLVMGKAEPDPTAAARPHAPAPMAPRNRSGLYCSACGASVTLQDKFCHGCGVNLAADR